MRRLRRFCGNRPALPGRSAQAARFSFFALRGGSRRSRMLVDARVGPLPAIVHPDGRRAGLLDGEAGYAVSGEGLLTPEWRRRLVQHAFPDRAEDRPRTAQPQAGQRIHRGEARVLRMAFPPAREVAGGAGAPVRRERRASLARRLFPNARGAAALVGEERRMNAYTLSPSELAVLVNHITGGRLLEKAPSLAELRLDE